MSLGRVIVRELARPSWLTGRAMNLSNAKINQQAIELLQPASEHRVLEVGFGGGAALTQLAARARWVAGIDPSSAAVRAARKRLHSEIAAGRAQIREAAVEQIPFGAGCFDRAISVNTIYFWSNPDAGLREIRRVLKPGGRLVIATELRRIPKRIAASGFTTYTEADQAEMLGKAGLSNVRLERRGPFVFATAARREQ